MIEVNIPAEATKVTAPPLWQWDYGQTLRITGLNLPQMVNVHFCDRTCKETKCRIGNKVAENTMEVAIPDALLENGFDINVFIYVQEYDEANWINSDTVGNYYKLVNGEYQAVTLPEGYVDGTTYYQAGAKTIKHIEIPIIARKKPEDFLSQDEPEALALLQQAVIAVNGTLTRIEGYYDQTMTYDDLEAMVEDTFNEKCQTTMTYAELEAMVRRCVDDYLVAKGLGVSDE